MGKMIFYHPLVLVIPITFIIITHYNVVFNVFHLLFLQCCMGQMPSVLGT